MVSRGVLEKVMAPPGALGWGVSGAETMGRSSSEWRPGTLRQAAQWLDKAGVERVGGPGGESGLGRGTGGGLCSPELRAELSSGR